MEEKELIDLLNSITYGEMSLNELSENSIKKTKVIEEIRKLYSTIATYRMESMLEGPGR